MLVVRMPGSCRGLAGSSGNVVWNIKSVSVSCIVNASSAIHYLDYITVHMFVGYLCLCLHPIYAILGTGG